MTKKLQDFQNAPAQRLGRKKLARPNEIIGSLKVKAVKVLPQKALIQGSSDPVQELISQLNHNNAMHRKNTLMNLCNLIKEDPEGIKPKCGSVILKTLKCAVDASDKVRAQYHVLLKRLLQTININKKDSKCIEPFLDGFHLEMILTHSVPSIRAEILTILELFNSFLEPSSFLKLVLNTSKRLCTNTTENNNTQIVNFIYTLYRKCLDNTNFGSFQQTLYLFRITDLALSTLSTAEKSDEQAGSLFDIMKDPDSQNEEQIHRKNLIETLFQYIESLQHFTSPPHKLNYNVAGVNKIKSLYQIENINLQSIALACICHIFKLVSLQTENLQIQNCIAIKLYQFFNTYMHSIDISKSASKITYKINLSLIKCMPYLYKFDAEHSLLNSILLYILPSIYLKCLLKMIKGNFGSREEVSVLLSSFFQFWTVILKPLNFYSNSVFYLLNISPDIHKCRELIQKTYEQELIKKGIVVPYSYIESLLCKNREEILNELYINFLETFLFIWKVYNTTINNALICAIPNETFTNKYEKVIEALSDGSLKEDFQIPETDQRLIVDLKEFDSIFQSEKNHVTSDCSITTTESSNYSSNKMSSSSSSNSAYDPRAHIPRTNKFKVIYQAKSTRDSETDSNNSADSDEESMMLNSAFCKRLLKSNYNLDSVQTEVNSDTWKKGKKKRREQEDYSVEVEAEDNQEFQLTIDQQTLQKLCSTNLYHIASIQENFINLCSSFYFNNLIEVKSNNNSDHMNAVIHLTTSSLSNQRYWLLEWLFVAVLGLGLKVPEDLQKLLTSNLIKLLQLINGSVPQQELVPLKVHLLSEATSWKCISTLNEYHAAILLYQLLTASVIILDSVSSNILKLSTNVKKSLIDLVCLCPHTNVVTKLHFLKIFTTESCSILTQQCKAYLNELGGKVVHTSV